MRKTWRGLEAARHYAAAVGCGRELQPGEWESEDRKRRVYIREIILWTPFVVLLRDTTAGDVCLRQEEEEN